MLKENKFLEPKYVLLKFFIDFADHAFLYLKHRSTVLHTAGENIPIQQNT